MPLAIPAAIVAAVLVARIAFRLVRGASGAPMLISSFVVSTIQQVLFQNLIPARSHAVALPAFLSESVEVDGIMIGVNKIAAIAATVLMLVFPDRFIHRRKTGIAMRAVARDFALARLMGIRANMVIAGAFAISGLLAGVAAVLWVSQRATVDPLMGFPPVAKAFIAAILGGLGSLRGAVAGGFAPGFIEVYLAAFLPQHMQEFRNPIGLGIVVLIRLFRLNGMIPSRFPGSVKVGCSMRCIHRAGCCAARIAIRSNGSIATVIIRCC